MLGALPQASLGVTMKFQSLSRSRASVCAGLSLLLTAAGVPAQAADKDCKLIQITSVEMTEMDNGLWSVPMTLNGKVAQMMFDTGGGIRALRSEVVDELGIPRCQGDIQMYDVKSAISRDQVKVPDVVFAWAKMPDGMVFTIMAGASRAERSADERGESADQPRINDPRAGRSFDGILTPDVFFQKADIELDFSGKRLVLFSNDHCKGKVVYWPAPALAAVPFRFLNNHITFDAQLDGQTVRAVLDTGASINTVNLGLVQRVFDVDVNAPDVKAAGELLPGKPIYEKRFGTLSFGNGDITITKRLMTLIPDVMPTEVQTSSRIRAKIVDAPAMLIGMLVLRRLRIYIAFDEGMLYITPGAGAKVASPTGEPVAAPETPAQ